MRNVKYTDSVTFRCLEHLRETSLDISLIHAGKERCEPSRRAGRIYFALYFFRQRLLFYEKREYFYLVRGPNVFDPSGRAGYLRLRRH